MQFNPTNLWIPDLEIPHVYGAFIKSDLPNLRLYLDQLETMGFSIDCSKLHELQNIRARDLAFLFERMCRDLFNEVNVIMQLCECNLRFCRHCNLHKSRQVFMHKFPELSEACRGSTYIYLFLVNNEVSRGYLDLQKEYLPTWIKTKIIISDSDKYTHLNSKEYIVVGSKDTSLDLPKDCEATDILVLTKSSDMVLKIKNLLIRTKKRMLS